MADRPAAGEFLRRRYRVLLLGILILALAVRLAVWMDRSAHDPGFDSPGLDSRVYLEWAGRIAYEDFLGDRPFFLNPLYAYSLAPVVRLAGSDVLDVTRLLQTLLGLGAILLTAATTRRLAGPAAALLTAGLMAGYGPLHFWEQVVMIVALAVFLNALLLWLLARFADRPTGGMALLGGLALGLSALARPNVALLGLLLPIWFLFLTPAGASRVRFVAARTFVVAVGSLLVILPVTWRNWVVGEDLVFVTSSAGVNLYQSNNPAAREEGFMLSAAVRGNPRLIENDSIDVAEAAEGRELRPSEVSAYWTRRTLEEMAEDPAAAAGFFGRKFLFFLSGYEISSTTHYEAERSMIATLGLNPLTWSVVSPLALIGLGFVAWRRRRGMPWLLLYVTYAAGLTIFFPLGHYRAPVLPAALPLAALGLLALAGAARSPGWGRRGAAAAVLLGAVLITNVPPIVEGLGLGVWRDDTGSLVTWHYNRGLQAVRRGDFDRAEELFARARALDPDSVLADQGLADLAMARGDLAAEARHLEAVLVREPGNAAALARHGLVLFDRGEIETGIEEVERASAIGPSDWVVFRILGEVRERTGRFAPALAAYEHAIDCGLAEIDALPGIARCLRALGRPLDAIRRLDEGLARRPEHPFLHLEMALALVESGTADVREVERHVRVSREAGVIPPAWLEEWLRKNR